MKNRHVFVIALCALLGGTAIASGATDIYKYRQPDGGILYTQKPQKRTDSGTLLEIIEVPAQTPQQIAAQRAANTKRKLQSQTARNDRAGTRRESQGARTDIDVNIAAPVLPVVVPAGRTPLPGERQGIVGGGTRLNDAYWYRMWLLSTLEEPEYEQRDEPRTQMLYAP